MKRLEFAALLALAVASAPLSVRSSAQAAPDAAARGDAASPLAGIGNQGRNPRQPYATAGDRAYLIGTQDGDFPDMGQHVPGEMGGLWLPPIKLVDGFLAQVEDADSGERAALAKSGDMIAYPHGNRFGYRQALPGLDVERFQFVPDRRQGLVVQYSFKNAADRARRLRFEWSVKTDLRPGWYADRLGIVDGEDTVEWDARKSVFVASDADNSWFVVWGAASAADGQRVGRPLALRTGGRGAAAASAHAVSLGPHGAATLTFVVAGSATSRDDALRSYEHLAANHAALLAEKTARYRTFLERARIRIPDRRLQQVYDWVRIDMQWLVRDVPGVGRGLSGGFMEYPWWFGTETYSLQALAATGDFELAEQTLRLLRDGSAKTNGNGRIVHELTPDGAVANPGNTQETAQFVMTVGKLLEWTGDLRFAKEMYPAVRQGIGWLLGDMDSDKDLFPEGYGIMEVSGLNAELIDTAVYTQQALEAAALIAAALHDSAASDRYRQQAIELKRRIDRRFWSEKDGSYADFHGSRSQAIAAVDGAIRQIGLKGADKLTPRDRASIAHYRRLKAEFSAMPEGERAWITNQNWVIATPMETGIAPRARAIRLLDKIRDENSGEYGPYLSAVEKQAMMTISTGVQAVAEGEYGRTDQAMRYVDKIAQTFGRVTPGSISEMMPDYGCFAIAWTSYGVVLPLIEHVFGVHPDALNKRVVFEPHLPDGWEDVSLENLPIGKNSVSFSRARTADGIEYVVEADQNGWDFVLKAERLAGARYFVNGKATPFEPSGFRMTGRRNLVQVLPPGRDGSAPKRAFQVPSVQR